MGKINTIFSENNAVSYVLMIFLISFSGNPIIIQSEKYELYSIIFTIFIVIFVLFKDIKLFISPILLILFFALIFLLQTYNDAANNLNSIVFFSMKILIGALTVLSIGKKFPIIFFNVMFAICLISLILFLYNYFVGIIPGIQFVTKTSYKSSILVYTQFLANDSSNISEFRNSGMFWEPGAFQGFINLAFLLIFTQINFLINNKFKLFIMITALITTFSTTGYIVFIFLMMMYIYKYSVLNPFLKAFVLFACLIIAYYAYNNLYFLSDKILNNMEDLDSYGSRLFSIDSIFRLLDSKWLIGLGLKFKVGDTFNTLGNGIVWFMVTFGVLGTLFYLISILYSYHKQVGIWFSIFSVLALILICFGEVFNNYPLFLALSFIDLTESKIHFVIKSHSLSQQYLINNGIKKSIT